MQSFDFEHFSSNNHNGLLEDCSITLIDKQMGRIPLEERSNGEEFCRLSLFVG